MLTVPLDWGKRGIGCIVTDILQQAQAAGDYERAASVLVRACLEQFIESRQLGGDDKAAVRRTRYGWRLGIQLYHVIPQVDDAFLDLLPKLARMRLESTVLVPPWSTEVARHCGEGLTGRGNVQVVGIDHYVVLRLGFTMMDLRIGREPAMERLFWWYNTIAGASAADADKIFIREMKSH